MQCTDAIGFRAAAALEAYEEQLAAVCERGAAPECTGMLQVQLRRVCTCCLPLPRLSGAALALLLAHHRFLAELSRSGSDIASETAARSLACVRQCVQVLKRLCRELFLAAHLH